MRRLLFLSIGCSLVTLLPPPLSAQSSGKGPSITFPAPTPQNAAEREIRSAEEQMHAAYVRADKKLFRSLYADDSTFTYWTGQTVGPLHVEWRLTGHCSRRWLPAQLPPGDRLG